MKSVVAKNRQVRRSDEEKLVILREADGSNDSDIVRKYELYEGALSKWRSELGYKKKKNTRALNRYSNGHNPETEMADLLTRLSETREEIKYLTKRIKQLAGKL